MTLQQSHGQTEACSSPPTAGVQCVHVRQATVLQAVPGVRYSAPEPQEGVSQFQLPEASREMALLAVGTAAGRTSQRPGGISGARSVQKGHCAELWGARF